MARVTRTYNNPDTNSTGPKSFIWPANLKGSFDYLHLEIVEYIPLTKTISATPSTQEAINSTPNAVGAIPGFNNLPPNNFSNTQLRVSTQKYADVYLPIPEDLTYVDAPEWSDTAIGVGGKTLPSIVRSIAEGEPAVTGNAISDLAKGGKIGLIAEIVNGLNFNFNALTQGINGKVINPYREQIFSGLGMRTFEYKWILVPRNKAEQLMIDKMIKTLRGYSLPNYSGSLEADGSTIEGQSELVDTLEDRWLDVPKIFRLNWKTSDDNLMISLPKIKPCVCTSVRTIFTPNNVWATHMIDKNPYPVSYELSLQFQETEIVTGSDVLDRGY